MVNPLTTRIPWLRFLRLTSPRFLRLRTTSPRISSKQCSGKSHVDDPDLSVVHIFRQNKAGKALKLRLSSVSAADPHIWAGSMSSPPKEKIETKGGHLPAGKAPCAVVLGVFFLSLLWIWRPFVCAMSQIKKRREKITWWWWLILMQPLHWQMP